MLYDYELALILAADTTEEKQKKILDEVTKLISAESGKIASSKLWGKKKLAYPIKKIKEGYYYLLNFTLDGKEMAALNMKLKLNEGILRYLILRK